VGIDIPWVTSIPALALLMAPLTAVAGAVCSYNVLLIAAPALDAAAAYWLCFQVTERVTAAWIGGFLYGFSSYVVAQDMAELNLSVAFCPPLLLAVALARIRGTLPFWPAVWLAAVLLIVQLLICIEVSALMLVFGGIAWALAWAYQPSQRRALLRLISDGLAVGAVVLVILGRILWQMFITRHDVELPVLWNSYFTADLLNIFVPTHANLWGAISPLPLPDFGLVPEEQDAYLGLPLICIVIGFARTQPALRWMTALFVVLLMASLGPNLWVDHRFTGIVLPWRIVSSLPLLNDALPARFALFVALCAAVMAAVWVAAGPSRRHVWGGLACLVLLPSAHDFQPLPQTAFFAPGRLQSVLGPNPRLLILPFAINGPASFWQAENHFGFAQSGGYVGYPPAPMQRYPAVAELFGGQFGPHIVADLANFAISTGTQFIIVGPGTAPQTRAAVSSLGWPTRHIDEVTIVAVPKNN